MTSNSSRPPSAFRGNYSDNIHVSAKEIALDVLLSLGFSRETVARILDRITVTGSSEPLLPCVFRITDSATAMHVCLAVLANLYGLERQGYLQDGTVDADNASLMFCLSTAWEWYGRQLFPGKLEGPKEKPLFYSDGIPALSGFPPQTGVTRFLAAYRQVFETGDKRYLFLSATVNPRPPEQLLSHLNFTPAQSRHLLTLFDSPSTNAEAVNLLNETIKTVPSALDKEREIFEAKAGGAWAFRTLDEFLESEQGVWCKKNGQISVEQVGKEVWGPVGFGEAVEEGQGVYKGIKVVEMTRVVMGPVITTTIAGLGADVVRIHSASINESPSFNFTQTLNKRCLTLDLKNSADKAAMDKLLEDVDIFVQNNSYGAVERLGYGFEDLLEKLKHRKKGFIYCEGSTVGFEGSWASLGGFDTVGQVSSGLALAMGREIHNHDASSTSPIGVKPWVYPGTICDTVTGLSAAVGMHAALLRRAKEGGSYRIRVALARTGVFFQELGMYQDKQLRRKVMNGRIPYLEPLADPTTRFFGVMDSTYNFHEMMREQLPELFTDAHWMTFKDSLFGGVPLRIARPALQMSRNPFRIMLQPRPLGYDSTRESAIYDGPTPRWATREMVDVELDSGEGKFRTKSGKNKVNEKL